MLLSDELNKNIELITHVMTNAAMCAKQKLEFEGKVIEPVVR